MNIVISEPLGVKLDMLHKMSDRFREDGHNVTIYSDRKDDAESMIKRCEDADIAVFSNIPFKADVLSKCKNLKMLSVAFTGVDHVDIDYCKNNNIKVCNASGYSTNSVAELAFSLMLSLYRRVVACDNVIRHGGTKNGLVGFELNGKTLGIVGTGAIGMKVCEIAKAFGCKVIAYSRTKKTCAENLGIEYVSLEELFRRSDIVSLHVPLTPDTKNLVDENLISLMKPTAILINTARGPVVDSTALALALNQGKIAGAGIDVFEMEPPVPENHPLITAKNTVLTPHVAFATEEALIKRAKITLDNIASYIEGTPQNIIV